MKNKNFSLFIFVLWVGERQALTYPKLIVPGTRKDVDFQQSYTGQ